MQTSLFFQLTELFLVDISDIWQQLTPKRDDRIEWKNYGKFLEDPFIVFTMM